jgi:hypothetical protein
MAFLDGDFMLRRKVVLAVPLVCLAAAGCGSGNGAPATTEPSIASAFLFVLTPQDGDKTPAQLSVFQTDAKGDLQLADRRVIEDANAMAVDPKGRFVFVAGGKPTNCSPDHSVGECRSFPAYLLSHAVDTPPPQTPARRTEPAVL